MNLPVHTHLVVCCPAFNPCRLPMVWPCAADTKARLFAAKFYHSFLEKFATLQAEKADRVMYGLCNQLDFIKGSLHQITPGTALPDMWRGQVQGCGGLPCARLTVSHSCPSTQLPRAFFRCSAPHRHLITPKAQASHFADCPPLSASHAWFSYSLACS